MEIAVTGIRRTLVAVQRMIPAWAQTMNGHQGWTTKAASLPNGELLTVTATDPKEIQHLRGLGFIGLLVSGSQHQPHHLAMAKGELDHQTPGPYPLKSTGYHDPAIARGPTETRFQQSYRQNEAETEGEL